MSQKMEVACDSCGAEIFLSDGESSKKCGFCGSMVHRPEDGATPSPTSKIRTVMINAVESENWEEVTKYSTNILEEDPTNYEAWLYKGAAAGWSSRHIDDPSKEITNCFRNAFANAEDEDLPAAMNLLASKGTELLLALARGSRNFAQEHGYLDVGDVLHNSWQDDVMKGHISKVIGFIDVAYLLTEINRNDRVPKLNPLIDSQFLKLYAFLFTEVGFEGKFGKKNPFSITDVTFTFVLDHDNESGKKWSARANEILENFSSKTYEAEDLEEYSLGEENFTNPRQGDLQEAEAAGGGYCFVATACLEDHDAVVLENLRVFRDRVLQNSPTGRMFVRCYYRLGPHAANLIAKNDRARSIVRSLFVLPLEKWVTRKFKSTMKI
jgi:hypothetical protein